MELLLHFTIIIFNLAVHTYNMACSFILHHCIQFMLTVVTLLGGYCDNINYFMTLWYSRVIGMNTIVIPWPD